MHERIGRRASAPAAASRDGAAEKFIRAAPVRSRCLAGAAARPAAVCGLAVGCERFLGAALDRCTWALRKRGATRRHEQQAVQRRHRRCGDRDCVESTETCARPLLDAFSRIYVLEHAVYTPGVNG